MSVQAVAERAKVTKGGLYHHFPSKDALIDGMFEHLLSKLDAVIDALMEQDPQPTGSFTRAYVDSTLLDEPRGIPRQWSALVISMAHEPRLQRRWFEWLAARLERHKDTDGSADHELVRLAADGAWLSLGLNPSGNLSAHAAQLRERLHQLTRA